MSLYEIQQKLNVPKNQYNKFGKYNFRSAEDIVEAVKPLLAEYKYYLATPQSVVMVGDRIYIETRATIYTEKGTEVAFATAQAREDESQKGMSASQLSGATGSYSKKYALNNLFAIDDTKDADATNTHGKKTPVEKKHNKTVKDAGILEKYIESIEKNQTIKEMDDWTRRMTPHVDQLSKELQGQVWGHYNDWRNTLAS